MNEMSMTSEVVKSSQNNAHAQWSMQALKQPARENRQRQYAGEKVKHPTGETAQSHERPPSIYFCGGL